MLAALAGAEVARARYGSAAERTEKDGVDFTTAADIEAEHAIRAVLTRYRPDDAIVGEELGSDGESSRRWLVDPICGTLNFAAGVPLFGVNVALEVDGTTTAAAVADPAAGSVFWTDGVGAWRRQALSNGTGLDGHGAGADHGRALATSAALAPDTPLAPTASSRLVALNLEQRLPDRMGLPLLADPVFRARFRPQCLSTTLALAWVATGQQAGYVTGGELKGSVHWAAAIALCRAAGVVLTNLDGGELHTGVQGLVAAADPETHRFLLASLDPHRTGTAPAESAA